MPLKLLSKSPPNRGVRDWADTVKAAQALEDIKDVIANYLPPDSRVEKNAVISDIIGITEKKTGKSSSTSNERGPAAFCCRAFSRPGRRTALRQTTNPILTSHYDALRIISTLSDTAKAAPMRS